MAMSSRIEGANQIWHIGFPLSTSTEQNVFTLRLKVMRPDVVGLTLETGCAGQNAKDLVIAPQRYEGDQPNRFLSATNTVP